MPQLNTIVLNDGTNDHTFTPEGIDAKGVASLSDASGATPDTSPVLTISSRKSPTAHRVTAKIVVPIVGTDVNGRDVRVETNQVDISFRLAHNSTLVERELLSALTTALSGHATLAAMVEELQGIY